MRFIFIYYDKPETLPLKAYLVKKSFHYFMTFYNSNVDFKTLLSFSTLTAFWRMSRWWIIICKHCRSLCFICIFNFNFICLCYYSYKMFCLYRKSAHIESDLFYASSITAGFCILVPATNSWQILNFEDFLYESPALRETRSSCAKPSLSQGPVCKSTSHTICGTPQGRGSTPSTS